MLPLTNYLHNIILTKLLLEKKDVEACHEKFNERNIQEMKGYCFFFHFEINRENDLARRFGVYIAL